MRSLSTREKILIYVLSSVAAGALLYTFIISPLLTPKTDGGVSGGPERLRRMERLSEEYKSVKQDKNQILSQLDNKNENTSALIQQCASTNGIEKNIAYTRRSQSTIQNKYNRITTDVKIDGVYFQPLVKFLNDIESSPELVRLQYVRITKALKGTNTYDVQLKIDTFTSNK
jgi:Tfp pilus assembly protein PilO